MPSRIGRTRLIIGLTAAAILVASGLAHSLLGWPAVRAALNGLPAPAGFTDGLAVPWHFTGMSMIAFGAIVVVTLVRAARRDGISLEVVGLIGAAYLVFGVVGAIMIELDPTFAMFIVPGVLLIAVAARNGLRQPRVR